MTKYKRWILLLSALTVFVVPIESLKATSLIHAGKFSKLLNTTTTVAPSASTTDVLTKDALLKEILEKAATEKTDEKPDEGMFVEVNGTKIALTGIPQIDYVWDPNLPRELNGFNLSSYPFIDSMPAEEDIGFNCDDKINGFYASIKFGCQIYHHCLYGVRSDFICANFTAFDQKTFICHFASEVDCKNSWKYWNRNDDLYKATTEKSTPGSSVLVPLIDRNLYKRPAPGSTAKSNGATKTASLPGNREASRDNANEPQGSTLSPLHPLRNANSNAKVTPDDTAAQRPGNRPLRRPYRRRRPQVDYYYYDDEEYEDEFYDDRGRRRQQRPRNRRPAYDDYRDTRRPQEDDFDDYEYERRPYRSRNRSESRRYGDDRRKDEERRFDDRRRPYSDERKPVEDRKRPIGDERRSYDDRRFSDDRRQMDDRKRFDEDKSQSDDRKSNRRKNVDDPIEDKRRERVSERGEQTDKRQTSDDGNGREKAVKPSGSIFDRPRPLPKIARPINRENEKNKKHKPEEQKKKDDEYYEEYDDVAASSTSTTTTARPTTKAFLPRSKPLTTVQTTKKPSTTTTQAAQEIEYYEDEYYDTTTQKPVETSTLTKLQDRAALFNSRNRNSNVNSNENFAASSTTPASSYSNPSDNFRLNRFKSPGDKQINQTAIRNFNERSNVPYVDETSPESTSRRPVPTVKKFANKQTMFEPTTTETTRVIVDTEPPQPIVESPTTIGYKFWGRNTEQPETEPEQVDDKDQKFLMRVIKRPFLPSRGGSPYKARGLQPVGPASLQFNEPIDTGAQFTSSGSDYPTNLNENTKQNNEQLNKHMTKLDDIYNEEYDVELNDALNPMLKPLTSSRSIGGFSFSSLPNDERDGYRAQSIKNIQKTEAPKTTTTTTTESPQYEYEEVEYEY